MFTWGSKYLFAVAGASLLGASVYGLISGGELLGVVSVGYKGGVGDHTGYAILISIGVVTAALAVLSLVTRDGDADEAAAAVGVNHALTVTTPRVPSFWGPLTAFGVACLAVGLAVSQAFFILGIVVLSVVTLEWLVLAWSDRATGDEEVNAIIRRRMIGPLEIPLLSLLGIGVLVIGLSRVFLSVPDAASSTAVAAVVAATIFGSAVAIAKANASRSVIAGVVAVAAVAVLAGGVIGAVVGERPIAHDSESETLDEGGEGEGE